MVENKKEETMTLKQANMEVERLENNIKYWLKEKELLDSTVLPHAIDTTKEVVQGGKRVNKLLEYVISSEEKKINDKLDILFEQKRNIKNFITKELEILNMYKPLEEKIRCYREEYHIGKVDVLGKPLKPLTWREIGEMLNYSPDYCREVYRKYKRKRDV